MEAFPLRGVGHDERLTIIDEHLSELRARLVLSGVALGVLFAACLWQSRALLAVLNAPLAHLRTSASAQGSDTGLPEALARTASAFVRLAHASSLRPPDQQAALTAARSLAAASRSLAVPHSAAPITLGLGEPFSTSMIVAFAFALLIGLPLLLVQAWAYIGPAFAPSNAVRYAHCSTWPPRCSPPVPRSRTSSSSRRR